MERKVTKTKVGVTLEIDTEYDYQAEYTPIDDIINYLIDEKHKGASHIEFSGCAEYDNSNNIEEIEFTPIILSVESDDDYNMRKEQYDNAKRIKDEVTARNLESH